MMRTSTRVNQIKRAHRKTRKRTTGLKEKSSYMRLTITRVSKQLTTEAGIILNHLSWTDDVNHRPGKMLQWFQWCGHTFESVLSLCPRDLSLLSHPLVRSFSHLTKQTQFDWKSRHSVLICQSHRTLPEQHHMVERGGCRGVEKIGGEIPPSQPLKNSSKHGAFFLPCSNAHGSAHWYVSEGWCIQVLSQLVGNDSFIFLTLAT